MIKPFFLYWAHKEMWASIKKLSEELERNLSFYRKELDPYNTPFNLKLKAYNLLRKKYPSLENLNCFIESNEEFSLKGNISANTEYSVFHIKERAQDVLVGDDPINFCFACNALHIKVMLISTGPCVPNACVKYCPLDWSSIDLKPDCSGSYRFWLSAIEDILLSKDDRIGMMPSEMADKIANIPLRKDATKNYVVVFPAEKN